MTDYEVGYAKPPKSGQFKRGKSGNPTGRPKGSLKLATDLASELNEQVTVREAGRTRRISKQRALIKTLMAKALGGDIRANAALLGLQARLITDLTDDNGTVVDETELEILRRYMPKIVKSGAMTKRKRPK